MLVPGESSKLFFEQLRHTLRALGTHVEHIYTCRKNAKTHKIKIKSKNQKKLLQVKKHTMFLVFSFFFKTGFYYVTDSVIILL